MNKYVTCCALSFFLAITTGCGGGSSSTPSPSGGGTPTPTPAPTPTPTLENASILSFSQNIAYSGDVVTITGTNFSNNPSNITVSFGGAIASVLSASETSIEIQVPDVENITTEMTVSITERTVSNFAETDFNQNMAIHPKKINAWTISSNNFGNGVSAITGVKIIDDLTLYIARKHVTSIGTIYRSQDGGINWYEWSSFGYATAFYPHANGTGWAGWQHNVLSVPAEGDANSDNIIYASEGDAGIAGLYVSDDLSKGVVIHANKAVYVTNDGVNFTNVYDENLSGNNELYTAFSLDEHHVWAGGLNRSTNEPYLLYCNGDNTVWNIVEIPEPAINRSRVRKIQFLDSLNGFASTSPDAVSVHRLYHSIDGGTTWNELNMPEGFTHFVFKDINVGWVIANNNIHKTLDGGLHWTVDYSHNEELSEIAYANGLVWSNSSSSMLKYFEE